LGPCHPILPAIAREELSIHLCQAEAQSAWRSGGG
jgi:hypothetical protein